MKNKIGPAAIIAAVVVLAVVFYGLYSFAFQTQSPPAKPENAPGYAKERGMLPGQAQSSPASTSSSAPQNAPASSISPGEAHRPAYGQGSGYGAGGPMSRPSGYRPGMPTGQ
jgi:hypothetical protein